MSERTFVTDRRKHNRLIPTLDYVKKRLKEIEERLDKLEKIIKEEK